MITQYQPPGIAREGRPYQLAYAKPNAGMYAILSNRGMARGFCKGTQSCCRLRASVGFGSPLVIIADYCSPCGGWAQSWPCIWWTMTVSNCRPTRCKRAALPTELIVRYGSRDRIRTDDFTVLQTVPFGHSGTLLWFGCPGWARTTDTRINSPLIYRLIYWTTVLVEAVGFEPTDPVS